jgi:hypothetical protein
VESASQVVSRAVGTARHPERMQSFSTRVGRRNELPWVSAVERNLP